MSVFNIFGNVKDKRFVSKALPMIIIGTFIYYLFVSLIGEQINILTTVLPQETGWNIGLIMNGYTIGGLISVPATFVINTALMKVSTKRFLIINSLIIAVCIALMGVSVKMMSMTIFIAAFLLIRVLAVCLQQSANYMCTEWFVEGRGKSLGFITMGAPIASASFVAIFTFLTASRLKFTGSYFIYAALLVVLAILVAVFYVDKPSDAGLYPDGEDHAPANEVVQEATMTLMDIMKSPYTWLITIAFGIIHFANNSLTAFFVTSMVAKEIPASMYLPVLSIGAIAGIPISYLLGAVDDKFGTIKASICLCGLSIIGFLGMAFAGPGTIFPLVCACFGYASITGAFPNLLPSIIAYVFGRQNYLGASRVIVSLETIIASFASQYMAVFLANGKLKLGYFGLIGMIVFAAVMICVVNIIYKKRKAA